MSGNNSFLRSLHFWYFVGTHVNSDSQIWIIKIMKYDLWKQMDFHEFVHFGCWELTVCFDATPSLQKKYQKCKVLQKLVFPDIKNFSRLPKPKELEEIKNRWFWIDSSLILPISTGHRSVVANNRELLAWAGAYVYSFRSFRANFESF